MNERSKSTAKEPTLAIVFPNYNHAKYLKHTLDCIFTNQTKQAHQVIIIDDGSTDNSVEIIESYKHHSNLIFIKNEKNLGVIPSVEKAAKYIEADYIYNTASDDNIFPTFVEKMLGLATAYPHAGICTSHPAYMDENGVIDWHLDWKKHSKGPTYFSPKEALPILGMGAGWLWVATHTSIFRRDLLAAAGGYIPELKWHADWFLDQVVAMRSGVAYIPEALSALRVLPASYSSAGSADPIEQSKVLFHMAHLMNAPEFADVKDGFINSSLLNCFGEDHKDYMLAILRPWGEQLAEKQRRRQELYSNSSFLFNKWDGIKRRTRNLVAAAKKINKSPANNSIQSN
jgi:glycosyltransferase involved in cell wall biosynthesis